MAQKLLSEEQVSSFYHDEFVADQVRHFLTMTEGVPTDGVMVDVGGGCGHFALAVSNAAKRRLRVIDLDPASVKACRDAGLDAVLGDALSPPMEGDEKIVSLNLILHHLVADTEEETRVLQRKALLAWREKASYIFINEYIYESYIKNMSGSLIYLITKNKILSAVLGFVSKMFPSLKANTFGVGVRFRSFAEWVNFFEKSGFRVVSSEIGNSEGVPAIWRFLFIKEIRRDSFLLSKF